MSENVCDKLRVRKPELLVPAGSLEVLKTAVLFGADAVYIGGDVFSLRAKAKNFTLKEMRQGIAFAHGHGVKVYVTANILAHNSDLEEAEEYFRRLRDLDSARPDALILSDPGMLRIAKRVWPEAEIHISTQANNTNYETFLFWHELGAKRVVSARELSLEEIRQIREKIPEDMEIESFVHGAMCISYSGRCLLSNYFTGRDANQGACTHPCRWKYAVVEESRPGEYLPIYENERGTFLFNSRDLCMIEHIPELLQAGIDSFKIEGRMKAALYVAAVTRTYRRAIDDYFQGEEVYRANLDWYREEIGKCTYRRFSTGFFFGKPSGQNQIYEDSTYVSEYIYLGILEEGICILGDFTEDYKRGKQKEAEGSQDEPAGKQNELKGNQEEPVGKQEKPEVRPELLAYLEKGLEEGRLKWQKTDASGERLVGMFCLWRITQRNKFSVGDHIEVMKPDGRNVRVCVAGMYDENMTPVDSAPHAQQKLWIWLLEEEALADNAAAAGDLLRVEAGNADP